MNERAWEIYDFIKAHIEAHSYPPTQQEIADGCYLSKSTVRYNLSKLERAGLIRIDPGRARGIALLDG